MRSAIFEAVEGAVRRTLYYDDASDVAGAFLSGGTDSSTVSGMIGRIVGRLPDLFFQLLRAALGPDLVRAHLCKEARDSAQRIQSDASRCTGRLHSLYLRVSEPLATARSFLLTIARSWHSCVVVVMLVVLGGVELFAGNKRYVQYQYFYLYRQSPLTLRSGLIQPLLCCSPSRLTLPGSTAPHARSRARRRSFQSGSYISILTTRTRYLSICARR